MWSLVQAMNKRELARYAVNLADFMRSMSDFFTEMNRRNQERLRLEPHFEVFEWEAEEDSQFLTLEDIGLDDTMPSAIVIELSQDGTNFKVWSPFDEDYKAELMRSIPKHGRHWDKTEKCWRIDVDWFGNCQRLMQDFFPDFERQYTDRAIAMCEQVRRQQDAEERAEEEAERRERLEEERRTRAARRRSRYTSSRRTQENASSEEDDDEDEDRENPYEVLGVRSDAPDEVIKAAYKAQAKRFHSDLGGDDAGMKRVNAAFEAIRRQRKWK
jgi:hypothetical protein